jgi:hypothetical protein
MELLFVIFFSFLSSFALISMCCVSDFFRLFFVFAQLVLCYYVIYVYSLVLICFVSYTRISSPVSCLVDSCLRLLFLNVSCRLLSSIHLFRLMIRPKNRVIVVCLLVELRALLLLLLSSFLLSLRILSSFRNSCCCLACIRSIASLFSSPRIQPTIPVNPLLRCCCPFLYAVCYCFPVTAYPARYCL